MQLTLAYGRTGLPLRLPDDANITLVEPLFVPGLPDESAAIAAALAHPIAAAPLAEQVRPGYARRRRLQRHHPGYA